MKTNFAPLLDKLYVFHKHSLLYLHSGFGKFEVDFKSYTFSANTVISLAPGQYFRLKSGGFSIILFEFSPETISRFHDSRFLFNHIVGLGYIDLEVSDKFVQALTRSNGSAAVPEIILTSAIQDWRTVNPFRSNETEVSLLFNLKAVIDKKFKEPLSITGISKELQMPSQHITRLSKEKLEHTIHALASNKLLLESKRHIVFTKGTTKEIAYDLGFHDTGYFNRFFKLKTGKTPGEYRQSFQFDAPDIIFTALSSLIDKHYKEELFTEFYAAKLYITPKTLSRHLLYKHNTSVARLVREKRLAEAVLMLRSHIPVHVVAWELGFKEPNHLSAFIKKNTAMSPTRMVARL